MKAASCRHGQGRPRANPALTGFPLFSVRQQDSPPDFPGARDSIGFSLIDLGQIKIGPALKLVWQRKPSDYAALNGLGDVGYALQAGGFAEYWPVSWLRLRGEARQGFGGETGVTGDLFADAIAPLGPWTLSAGPRLTLQSAAATGPYFSITQAQSAGSRRPACRRCRRTAPAAGFIPTAPDPWRSTPSIRSGRRMRSSNTSG